MMKRAHEAMGLSAESKTLSDDILRVEISGPKQPHLTLVDLPGVFHAGTGSEFVKNLVRKYMKRKRSIILAVVSASNDSALQLVTDMTLEIDPRGLRTLGIITKPDESKGKAHAFVNLAKNNDVIFRLGWHVLQNRRWDERDATTEQRDASEREFFSTGIWSSLPEGSVGIGALRPRLSNVLRNHILRELPHLIADVENGIVECRDILAKLGDARSTFQDQQRHLLRISQEFTWLVKAAVEGTYAHEFFGNPMTSDGSNKRLRSVVQNTLLEFASTMRLQGHRFEIVENANADGDKCSPTVISRSDFLDDVRQMMKKSRGRELPGTFNPLIVGDLFYRQSEPWMALVSKCCNDLMDATALFVNLALTATLDDSTRDGLLREIIQPAMDQLAGNLDRKVREIMRPHQIGHPITYNHHFTQTIQNARQEHERKAYETSLNVYFGHNPNAVDKSTGVTNRQISDIVAAITKPKAADMDQYSCSEATDCMSAYYKARHAMDGATPNPQDGG
jgi:hypothetical protein